MAAGEATWQASLRLALRSSSQLLEHVGVAPEAFALSEQASFPTLVPMEWLQRIRKGDPTDPLLLQVIAQSVEQETQPEDRRDPVGDSASEFFLDSSTNTRGVSCWLRREPAPFTVATAFGGTFPTRPYPRRKRTGSLPSIGSKARRRFMKSSCPVATL